MQVFKSLRNTQVKVVIPHVLRKSYKKKFCHKTSTEVKADIEYYPQNEFKESSHFKVLNYERYLLLFSVGFVVEQVKTLLFILPHDDLM